MSIRRLQLIFFETLFSGNNRELPVKNSGTTNVLLSSLSLCRLWKLERYVRAFTMFGKIVVDSLDVLAVTGFASVVTLVFGMFVGK